MHLIFDNIIFSLQRMGGISVVWQEHLTRALRDPRYATTVLDYPSSNVCRQLFTADADFQQAARQMPMRQMERYRQPDFLPTTPAIFHSSYFRILPQKGIYNITTIHDLTYHFYRRGAAKWVHCAEEWRALKASAGVICVSENTRHDLLHCYPWLDEKRVRVIYNGVGSHFRPLTAMENQGYILFVGNRAADYKRFDLAVEVARATQLPLLMIGGQLTPAEDHYLSQTLGQLPYQAISNIPNEQLNVYYNQALCLLYPSDYEGFGIPIIEAQKAGCPVIAQRCSSVPEVAGSDALLVDHAPTPKMIAQMADIVLQLKNGQLSRSDIQQKGYQNAARFSWDNTYAETTKFYDEIEHFS